MDPKDSIKILGVTIDNCLTFGQHTSENKSKVLSMLPTLYRLVFSRGASLATMHHLISTLAIPALLWGLEVWWTGAKHIVNGLNLIQNKLARLITGLTSWTITELPLDGASITPLDLHLDHTTRKYAIKTLHGPDNHRNKETLSDALLRPLPQGVGLRRVAHLLLEIVPAGTRIEKPDNPTYFLEPEQILIRLMGKTEAAAAHRNWLHLQTDTPIVYTDGSRTVTNSVEWTILQV